MVLDPTPESEEKILSQVRDFLKRPENRRSAVRMHIAVVIYTLPEPVVRQVTEKLEEVALKLKPVTIQLGGLQKFGNKYIAFNLVSKELIQTHEIITEALQPIVKNIFNPKYLEENLLPKQEYYLKNYGYHRIKEFFEPHLTIGKYDNETIRDAEIALAPKIEGELVFDKLVVDNSEAGSPIPSVIIWERKLGEQVA